jgi:two-component system C4-dicarboxylate transport response regulator DctD
MLDQISVMLRAAPDPVRIALADDDADMRHMLATTLRQDGHTVDVCEDGRELFAQLEAAVTVGGVALPDLVISDLRMPGMTGLEMLKAIRAAKIDVPVILVTAFGDDGVHQDAFELGATVMDKPFPMDGLRAAVRWLVRRRRPEDRGRRRSAPGDAAGRRARARATWERSTKPSRQ